MTEAAAAVAGTAEPPALSAAPSPDAPAPLTPYQRRKAREREREAAREKRRAARQTKAIGSAQDPSTEGSKRPSVAEAPERSDRERAADLAVFLSGVIWPVLSLVSRIFGWDLSPLDAAEAAEDAAAWVPAARRYRWLDIAATWAAAPARLVARVRQHAKRRERKPKAPDAPPAGR